MENLKIMIDGFFNKTFQRSDRFVVDIIDDMASKVHSFEVKSVRLPNYQFKTDKVLDSDLYPGSFTTFNLAEGMTFDVTFDENASNDIMVFIQSVIKKMINSNGVYNPISQHPIKEIRVNVLDEVGDKTMIHRMKNCRLTNYDPITLDYSNSDVMVINCTFVTNEYEIEKVR